MTDIARFRFKKYQIVKASIEFKNLSDISGELEISIKKSEAINLEDNKFRLTFDVCVSNKDKSLIINVLCLGYFDFEKDITEDEKKVFFNTSAPAILFPYIRAYISTLTTLGGIKSITLPTVNLTSGAVDSGKQS
ncbi:MAG: protein-export chaperone SecB [Dysgonamonadaceae bacterium]